MSSATYDVAGNLLTWNMNSYSWDRFNMMTRWSNGAEAWSYIYTADDERLWSIKEGSLNDVSHSNFTVRGLGNEVLTRDERRPGGTSIPGSGTSECTQLLPPQRIFCDRFETGNSTDWHLTVSGPGRTLTDYIYRGGQLLAYRAHDDGDHHVGLDHLGTIRVVDGDEGLFSARHTYFPFGREATSTSQNTQVMKFTGHERDLQSTSSNTNDDLDSMHARRMSPITGRFLSVDPADGRAKVPQSWNRYAYTVGNPLRYVDPDGACAVPSGLQAGQAGICIDSFISTRRFKGLGWGDNRGFSLNDPSAGSRTKLRMIFDPATGKMSTQAGASRSWIGLMEKSIGAQGSFTLHGGVTPGADGATQISFAMTGTNGFSAIADIGSIKMNISLEVSASGLVRVLPGSHVTSYPSFEGVGYWVTEDGVLISYPLFSVQEADPAGLHGPATIDVEGRHHRHLEYGSSVTLQCDICPNPIR